MEKRQKILLGLMVAVLLWGGYVQFLDTEPASGQQNGALDEAAARREVTKAVQRIGKLSGEVKVTELELERVRQAARPLEALPFYSSSQNFYLADSGPQEITSDFSEYKYNGYMDVNGNIFAIINGLEYTVGEELESSGFIIQSITRSFVVIESADENGNRVVTRKVPFVEEDTGGVDVKVVQ